MTQLAHLLRWDLVTQARHGFWIAAAFIIVPSVGIALSVSDPTARRVVPAAMFLDISMTGNIFMAAIYFFERREGSLAALVVTPVRAWQWLTAKVASLALLGTVMCLALVAARYRLDADWLRVVVATVCLNVLFVLLGFILAASAQSFTAYFLRFAPVFGVLEIPGLIWLGIDSPAYWALPTQPTVVLLRSAFEGGPGGAFALAFAAQIAWIALAFALCLHLFRREVADRTSTREAEEGTRASSR